MAEHLRTRMGRSVEVHLPLATAGRKMDRAEWIVVDDLQWPETARPESLEGVGVTAFMREYMHQPERPEPEGSAPRRHFFVELFAEPARRLAATIEQLPPETQERVRQHIERLSAEYGRRIEQEAIERMNAPGRYDPQAQTSGTRNWNEPCSLQEWGHRVRRTRPFLTDEARAFLKHPPA